LIGVITLIVIYSIHYAKNKNPLPILKGTTHLSFELSAFANEKRVIINETHLNTNLVLPSLYLPKGNRLIGGAQPNYIVQMPFPTSAGQTYTFIAPLSNFNASVKVSFEPTNIFTIPFYVRLIKDGGTVNFVSVNVNGTFLWEPSVTATSAIPYLNLVTTNVLGNPFSVGGALSSIFEGMLSELGYGILGFFENLFDTGQNQIDYTSLIFKELQQIVNDINSEFATQNQVIVDGYINSANTGFADVFSATNQFLGFPQTPNNTFLDYGQGSDPNALYSISTGVSWETYRQLFTDPANTARLTQVYTTLTLLLDEYRNISHFPSTNNSGQWPYYLSALRSLVSAGQQLAMFDTLTFNEGPVEKGFYPPWYSNKISQLQNDLANYLPYGYDLWIQYLQSYMNNITILTSSELVQNYTDGEFSCPTDNNSQWLAWCSFLIECTGDPLIPPPNPNTSIKYNGFGAGINYPPLTCYNDGIACVASLQHIVNNNDPMLQIPVSSNGFPTNVNLETLEPYFSAGVSSPVVAGPSGPTPANVIGSPDGLGGWTCQATITQDQLQEARLYARDYIKNYFGNPIQALDAIASIGGLTCTTYSDANTSCTALPGPPYLGSYVGTPFGESRFSASSFLDQVGVNLMESNFYSVTQDYTTKYFNETYKIAGFDGQLRQNYSSSIFQSFTDWDNICCPVGTSQVKSAFFGSVSESVGGANVPPTFGARKLKCYGPTVSNNVSFSYFLDTASECKVISPGVDLVSATNPVLVDDTIIGGNMFPAAKYQALNPSIDSALSAIVISPPPSVPAGTPLGTSTINCLCGVGNLQAPPTPDCPGLYTNTTCYPNKMSLQFIVPASWDGIPFPTYKNVYRSQFYMTAGPTTIPVNINYDGVDGCFSYGTNSTSPYIFSFSGCYLDNPSYSQGLLGACVNLSLTTDKNTFTTGDTITIEDWEMITQGIPFVAGGFCPSDNFTSSGAAVQQYASAFASFGPSPPPPESWTLLYYPNV
jgi:hypothetical protein